jgi:hypothetical protein
MQAVVAAHDAATAERKAAETSSERLSPAALAGVEKEILDRQKILTDPAAKLSPTDRSAMQSELKFYMDTRDKAGAAEERVKNATEAQRVAKAQLDPVGADYDKLVKEQTALQQRIDTNAQATKDEENLNLRQVAGTRAARLQETDKTLKKTKQLAKAEVDRAVQELRDRPDTLMGAIKSVTVSAPKIIYKKAVLATAPVTHVLDKWGGLSYAGNEAAKKLREIDPNKKKGEDLLREVLESQAKPDDDSAGKGGKP